MSFTAEVKQQLCGVDNKKKQDNIAEFCAVYMMTGGNLRVHTGHVARRAEKLCLRAGGMIEKTAYRAGAEPLYIIHMRWSGDFSLTSRTAAACFLRGCFLAGGYISEPDSTAHMEISFKEVSTYELGMAAFELCGIAPKGTIRGTKYVLYLKDAEQISAFLVTLGAIRAVLDYENVRIMREGRGTSNRVLNCDGANINKAIAAGEKQIKMIEAVMASGAFEDLPEGVRRIAELRLENPELSLSELGNMCDPPVSKAGAAHRLSKIEEVYKRLGP